MFEVEVFWVVKPTSQPRRPRIQTEKMSNSHPLYKTVVKETAPGRTPLPRHKRRRSASLVENRSRRAGFNVQAVKVGLTKAVLYLKDLLITIYKYVTFLSMLYELILILSHWNISLCYVRSYRTKLKIKRTVIIF
jgi:hypothetical protein